ncbi:histidine kinase [Nitrosopumilus sp. b1]|uniref:cobalamin B12-binding domain-containing protein n=1 Tax=Nitrosopumilus sp. b1 TaxID=2109907 RepID=UPI0015F5B2DC|nr:cobalamin-dependent protein [Nitrosopumilus sp. b1]KAF6243443.1 histidine kinase [Nitrosopumilus sp. b1]
MVYVRAKTVKGDKYLYLVKSKWDSKKNTSRQEIIKYLGKASLVKLNDVPEDYRKDPKILSFLTTHSGENIEKNQKLIDKVKKELFNGLTKGDLDRCLDIFESFEKTNTLNVFYDSVLKPIMYKIGDLWESNELSVATEHVSSNIAKELVSIITERNSILKKKNKILVCTPSGEEHNLGCNVIQSFLQSKGYTVYNISPSAPTESVLSFIDDKKPHAIFVSITLEDNIKSGQRLVSKINSEYNVPVLVGGQAVEGKDYKFDGEIIQNQLLEKIPRIIKQAMK